MLIHNYILANFVIILSLESSIINFPLLSTYFMSRSMSAYSMMELDVISVNYFSTSASN